MMDMQPVFKVQTRRKMNKQQLMDEKQELQKMLLKFEEEYSRPSQSHEKNKVRVCNYHWVIDWIGSYLKETIAI